MALSDYDANYYYWYYNAYGSLPSSMNVPSTGEGSNDFGEGYNKTKIMISAWNGGSYGTKITGEDEQKYADLWTIFEDANNSAGKVDSDRWFVPSKGEWSAFSRNLGVTSGNYAKLGLSSLYWSSSQIDTYYAYTVGFYDGFMNYYSVDDYFYVRLSATF